MFNTDQGSQVTSLEFTGLLNDHGLQISMDGQAAGATTWSWNKLWEKHQYEEVSRHAYETVSAAQQGVERYLTGYHQRRPHRAPDDNTPEEVLRQPAYTAHRRRRQTTARLHLRNGKFCPNQGGRLYELHGHCSSTLSLYLCVSSAWYNQFTWIINYSA